MGQLCTLLLLDCRIISLWRLRIPCEFFITVQFSIIVTFFFFNFMITIIHYSSICLIIRYKIDRIVGQICKILAYAVPSCRLERFRKCILYLTLYVTNEHPWLNDWLICHHYSRLIRYFYNLTFNGWWNRSCFPIFLNKMESLCKYALNLCSNHDCYQKTSI